MTAPVTLYLADDHQIIIDGLKLLISSEESIKVVGYANDGNTAYHEIIAHKPDLALIDLRMPGMTGLDLIFKLKKVMKETRFIILSMHDNRRYVKDALSGGASGYLLKNAGKAELMKCLSTVIAGGSYFPTLNAVDDDFNKSLFTPREQEILKLVLEGNTTVQIAEELSLSPFTVETHRKNIGRKTDTNTVLGLMNFLREHKIDI